MNQNNPRLGITLMILAMIIFAIQDGVSRHLAANYNLMTFAPARLSLKPGEGPPHIRLDRAVEFLIGDQL